MKNHSVGLFTWENTIYGAEASTLGLLPGEVPRETGITHRSGVITRFVFDQFEYDANGDCVSFNYNSTNGPEKLEIYND